MMTFGEHVYRHGAALVRRYKLDAAEERVVLWSLAGKTAAEIADGLGGVHCAPWLVEATLTRAKGKMGARGAGLFEIWRARLIHDRPLFVMVEAARAGRA